MKQVESVSVTIEMSKETADLLFSISGIEVEALLNKVFSQKYLPQYLKEIYIDDKSKKTESCIKTNALLAQIELIKKEMGIA